MSQARRETQTMSKNAARPSYVNGANAEMPEFRYQKKQLKFKHKKKLQLGRRDLPLPLPAIAAIIFVLAIVVAAQFAYVQSMGLQVSQSRTELNAIKAQNEALQREVAELGDLARVEKKASEELGMVAPEKLYTYTPAASAGFTGDDTLQGVKAN